MGDSGSVSLGQVPGVFSQHQLIPMVKMETLAPPSQNSSLFPKKSPNKVWSSLRDCGSKVCDVHFSVQSFISEEMEMPRPCSKRCIEICDSEELEQPGSVAGPSISMPYVISFLEQGKESSFGYQIAEKMPTPKQHIVGDHFYPILGSLNF